jgi:hypothetical protein
MEQVLQRLQQLPEALQQEALHYLEDFVAQHTAVEPNSVDGKTHPAAEFYGCIADDTFIRQPQGELVERESF